MAQKALVALEPEAGAHWLTVAPLPAVRESRSFFLTDAANGTARRRQAVVEAQSALNETIATATTVAQRARAMTRVLEEALAVLAVAEADLTRQTQMGGQDSALLASLSLREREVLALVAEGHSNRVIAGRLFVSPNTVKSHVASLLNKLRADSRVELAIIATRNQVDGPARASLPDVVPHKSHALRARSS
jgi:DNA-binding NarL/FixJ family response regulator